MSAARKIEPGVVAGVAAETAAAPDVRRAGPSASLDQARGGVNPLEAQHRLLEREFHIETTDVDAGHYPAAVRLGIVAGGAVLSWAAIIGVIAAVIALS